MPFAARTIKARLSAAIAVAAFTAGCSLNPFGQSSTDNVPSVESSSAPVSMSRPQNSAAVGQSGPVITPMQSIPLSPDAPDRYVVRKGDTLWDISAMFLKDPWYWPEIWQVNPQVANPHLIYPGDILTLIYVDGEPRIVLERGGLSAARMSPGVRIIALDEAITTIPYEQISAFLTRASVLEKDEVSRLPYVLAARGDHLIASAGIDVYVRGDVSGVGSGYNIVNVGGPLRDPDDNKIVGYEALHVGEGRITRGGDPSTLFINESSREVLNGDRLLSQDVTLALNFFPRAPEQDIEGQIISVVDGVSRIGQFQVVVINRGARDGLAEGHVLTTFQAGDTVTDRYSKNGLLGSERVTLPDEAAGTMMLFKIYDRISYGLIMKADSEIRVYDAVRNPQ